MMKSLFNWNKEKFCCLIVVRLWILAVVIQFCPPGSLVIVGTIMKRSGFGLYSTFPHFIWFGYKTKNINFIYVYNLSHSIYFVMKDYDDNIIAAGMSPPIMITDDHKSSKTKVGLGRKRPRAEYDRRNSSAHSADSPKSSDGLTTPPISTVTSSTGYSGQSSPVPI